MFTQLKKTFVQFSCFITAVLVFRASALELPKDAALDLQSLDFQKREAANLQLLEWGRKHPEGAMAELYRQSRDADDPEVRERCLSVLRDLVNDEYLNDGEGYLGIRRQDIISRIPGFDKERNGVLVVEVVAGSAAANAGLRANDQITRMNGEEWLNGPASELFAEKVRSMKPNTKVSLGVVRDGKLIEINVVLGKRPLLADHPFMNGSTQDLEALERADREAYFRRWLSQRNLSE